MLRSTFVHAPWIGYPTESRLWREGVRTWDDFVNTSPRLRVGGERTLEARKEIERSISRLRTKDHAFFSRRMNARDQWRAFGEFRDRAAYLDIETTGLRRNRHHLTVIGLHQGGRFRQFIEGVDLEEFPAAIGRAPLLVTFNGSRFDVPFLQARWPQLRFEQLHADLLYPLHRLGHFGGLKAIEREVGIERSDETRGVEGRDAAALWRRFQRNGDDEALEVLLRYNREDVENLRPLAEYAYRRLRAPPHGPGPVRGGA